MGTSHSINTRIIFDIVKYRNQFKECKTYASRKSKFNRYRILRMKIFQVPSNLCQVPQEYDAPRLRNAVLELCQISVLAGQEAISDR